MRKWAAALLGLVLATPVMAQEEMVFTPPEGFVSASEDETSGLREWLPEGEGPENWSRRVSYSINPLEGRTAEEFAILLGHAMQQVCEGLEAAPAHAGDQNSYGIQLMLTSCPADYTESKDTENAIIKVIAGDEAMHTVQFAWLGDLDEITIRSIFEWTVPQMLCNPDVEDAPCP
jgi:hypothetical protein